MGLFFVINYIFILDINSTSRYIKPIAYIQRLYHGCYMKKGAFVNEGTKSFLSELFVCICILIGKKALQFLCTIIIVFIMCVVTFTNCFCIICVYLDFYGVFFNHAMPNVLN